MALKPLQPSTADDLPFNMTSMIDVVFLLIIFFMLICQFIVQENYTLYVPDDCPQALVPDRIDPAAVTVSVFQQDDEILYAVRSQVFDRRDPLYNGDMQALTEHFSQEIKYQVNRKPQTLVHLRADRSLPYEELEPVFLALSRAGVSRVQLAAYRTDQETTP